MRICLVSRKVNLTGGIARYTFELCRFLARREHEVHLYVGHYDAPRIEGLAVHRVPMIYGTIFERMGLHALANLFQVTTFSLASLLMVPGGKYDIVHVQGDSLVMPDVRTAHSCHLYWIGMARKQARGLAGKLAKSLLNPLHMVITFIELKDLRNSSKVIAVSKRTADEITEAYGTDPGRIVAIPNGVDTVLFNPAGRDRWRGPVREEYGIGAGDRVLIFVAAEFGRKGLGVLLDAIGDIEAADGPETVLLVVGKDRPDEYEQRIRDSGLRTRVIFTGHLSGVERIFAAADIFVLPSIYEPFGLVLTEAMASGLPVVTTDRVGAASLIEDGRTGFVIGSGDIRAGLARVLKLLIGDPDRARTVGREARAFIEGLTWDDVGAMTEKVYLEIAEKRTGGPAGDGRDAGASAQAP
ncbi:MAG TPA: glycosyltransferase family 4 protein [Candidatus Krumholzibacterium sp.]|nr:glycosyltransferase family 4 protein [Candidatus Krumholzibacterium sp.]